MLLDTLNEALSAAAELWGFLAKERWEIRRSLEELRS